MNRKLIVKLYGMILFLGIGWAFGNSFSGLFIPPGQTNVVLPLNVTMPHGLGFYGTSGGPATACSTTPALPSGLTISVIGGACKITGTPTVAAAQAGYTINITTTGTGGGVNSTLIDTLTVTPVTGLKYTQGAANYAMGSAIDTNFATVTGSATSYAVTSGILPAGLVLNASSGDITGTPTTVASASGIVITASNGSFTSSATLAISVQGAADYSTWLNRKDITYTPSGLGANVGNYPLLVKLTSGNFDFSQSLSNISSVPSGTNYSGTGGADIRFTKADGVTDLPFQIERWNSTSSIAEIWVLVPSVSAGASTTIRMYWGKSGQATTNNATAVFDTANKFQAVWHMNNGGTGNELDATQNAITGIAAGTTNPTTSSTLLGLGRTFAGGTLPQSFTTTAASVRGFSQNGFYSISAWVSPATVSNNTYYTVIQKNDKQFAMQIATHGTNIPGKWESAEYNADSGGASGNGAYGWMGATKQDSLNATTGAHYLLGQHDGFHHRLYVDGSLLYDNVKNGSASPSNSAAVLTSTVTIGRQSESTTGRPWIGALDEIRMHNTVRDSNWVKVDYQTQSPIGTAVTYGTTQFSFAPSGLAYATNPAVYPSGATITPNVPSFTSGGASHWAINPALPAGLSFDTLTGVISGTPTVATAAANYQIIAGNNLGSDTVQINITVNPVAPTSLTYAPNTYLFGVNVAGATSNPTVNNGGAAITYTVSPALPAGLVLDPVFGAISGTPATAQAATPYLVTATNTAGADTETVTIRVTAPPMNLHYVTNPEVFIQGVAITPDTATVTDTVTAYSVSPELPAGLNLNSTTGIISGIPTDLATTPASYVVTATNLAGADTEAVWITVNPVAPSALSYISPVSYLTGDPVSNTPMITGNGVTFTVNPPLPAGLSLNSFTGVISGTPTASSGATDYVVTATNPSGSIQDTVSITVGTGDDYSQWAHFKNLNLTAANAGVTETQKNFPLLIRLTNAHRTIFQQAMASGEDIRFSKANGAHLPYQIERWSVIPSDTSAAIWVLLDSVSPGNAVPVRIYWGNAGAASRSSGVNVFRASDGFVGVWHMGDTTGIAPRPNAVAGAPAATPSNDNGTFGGTYVVRAGVIGQADTLRGGGTHTAPATTSDYFNLGNGSSTKDNGGNTYPGYNNFSTGLTYSLWARGTRPTANNSYLLELANGTGVLGALNNIQVFVPTRNSNGLNGVRYQTVANTTSSTTATSSANFSLPTSNPAWQHLVVTVDTGSTPTVRMYINGVSSLNANVNLPIDNILRSNAWLGKSNYNADPYFVGAIDEPEISNVARSPDWASLEYQTQNIGVVPVFDLSYASAVDTVGTFVSHSPDMTGTATVWSVTPPLPDGLSLNTSTGVISGIPTMMISAQTYTITAQNNSAWSTTGTLNLGVSAAPPTLAYTASSVSYHAGDAVNIVPTLTTGGAATALSVSPALPPTLSLNTSTGVITGVVTTPQGPTDYVITATNIAGTARDTVNITITAGEDYSTWAHHQDMTLNTSAANVGGLGNVPILVRLDRTHRTIFQQALASGADIRFANAGGGHLAYQIEKWSVAPGDTSAAIWVLADTLSGGATVGIRMYWGNGSATSDSRPSVVFSPGNGFEAVYHLNETVAAPGDSSLDATGNGHTAVAAIFGAGTVPGDATDGLGVGKTFNGNNSTLGGGYFLLTDSNAANTGLALNTKNGPWTISAWVKPTACTFTTNSATSGRYAILSKYSGTTGGQKAYFLGGNNAANQWKANFMPSNLNPTTGNNEFSSPTNACTAGAWQFISVSYASATDPVIGVAPSATAFDMTLNGSPNGTPSAGNNSTGGNGASVRIGASDDNARFMNGSIDEVVISRAQRSRDWVKWNYENQKPGVEPVFNLSYPTASPVFMVGIPIATDSPTVDGTPTSWSSSPALPGGLTLNASGVLTGTPTEVASGTYTITAFGGNAWSTTTTLNITVNPAPPSGLMYSSQTATYRAGDKITPNNPTLTDHGGGGITYSSSPSLPSGLTIDPVTGVISGRPTSATGTATYTISATNSAGAATFDLSITVTAGEDYSLWTAHQDFTLGTSATLAATATDQTNFPVLVRLNGKHAVIFNAALTSGADVRFSKLDGTHLPYQLERWSFAPGDTSAVIWVLADTVAANGTTSFRMYYGNGSAIDDSRPNAVFDVNNGYMGTWHMGDATGTAGRPNSTTGLNPASPMNGAPNGTHSAHSLTPQTGIIGLADSLQNTGLSSTTSSYFDLGTLPTSGTPNYKDFSNGLTYSVWAKIISNSQAYTRLIDVGLGNSQNDLICLRRDNATTSMAFEMRNGSTTVNSTASPTGVWTTDGAFHHYVATLSSSNVNGGKNWVIYKDGASVASGSASAAVSTTAARVTGLLGMGQGGDGNPGLVGTLDEVEISRVARSVDWVKLSYKNQKSNVTPLFNLSYTSASPVYTQNATVTANTPTVSGVATRYSVNPALPTGLALDPVTGIISGTPTVVAASAAYTVTAMSDSAWFTTATVNITVNPLLSVSTPGNVTVNVGDSAKFVDTVTAGTGPFTYKWVHSPFGAGDTVRTFSSSNTTDTLRFPSAQLVNAGGYKVVVSTGAGAAVSGTATLTVDVVPAHISSQPVSLAVPVGATAKFGVAASGTGPFTYKWLRNGIDSSVGGADTLTLPNVQLADSGATFRCVVSNAGGMDSSTIVILSVSTGLLPPVISYSPASVIDTTTQAVSHTISSTGGAITSCAVMHALPAGLSIDSTCKISGTPTAASALNLDTVTATGPGGTGSTTIGITVVGPPIVVYKRTVVSAVKNVAINPPDTVNSTGGPVTKYKVSTFTPLPAGLVLDTVSGRISGTPTAITSAANDTIIATGPGGTGRAVVNISVADTAPKISYSPASVIDTTTKAASHSVLSTGGAISSCAVKHALPPGLSIDSTCKISGTPTAASVANLDTVIATGPGGTATATITLTVIGPPVIVFSPASVTDTTTKTITHTPVNTGGPITSCTARHALPTGLTVVGTSCAITGTPTVASAANLDTLTAVGPGGTSTVTITITVIGPPILSFSPGSVTDTTNKLATHTPINTGGPIVSCTAKHALPAGLSVSSACVISGTPTAASAANLDTVTAVGPGGTATVTITITVVAPPVIAYSPSSVTDTLNKAATHTPTNTGGAITSCAVSHALPVGLILNSSSCVISGTPTAAAVANLDTVTAMGPGGTGSTTITITVTTGAGVPVIAYIRTTLSLSRGVAMTPDTVSSTGGAVTRYSVVSLPAGLALDTLTGVLSGTPSAASAAANYAVTATGPGGSGAATVNITVTEPAPVISYKQATIVATRSVAILSDSIVSTGGAVTKYSISPATLPTGLVFDTLTGVISGTGSAQSLPANYTITATGPGGTATTVVNISVYSIPSDLSYSDGAPTDVLTIPSSPNTNTVNGYITHYSVSPALPTGLKLDSLTGSITGTPTGNQSFGTDYTITASNPVGSTTAVVNITVVGAPSNLSYLDDAPTYAIGAPIAPPDVPTIQGIVTMWSVTPALPDGVVLDATTGYITGTPTTLAPGANYTVTGQNPGGATTTVIFLGVAAAAP